ncbi:hypothetical protein VXS12_16770 [Acinetobacter baumannii]|uniref:hypothetical protein n=1 Tax=Acinetobacter baumannii TaxID=470 RepID=UPI002E1761C1|nr:hypothetical protein [Acinetobacter baumannii]
MNKKSEEITRLNVSEILLDPLNPRLGDSISENMTQEQIVSLIVNNFGVDDLLSSMSFNGYFDAEPLVCQKRANGEYYVIEGNRRLVACLILSNDYRAKDYIRNFKHFINLHAERNSPNVSDLPVVIFKENEDPNKISAYLGIRHIVSTKDWDSFAKARWINDTITHDKITIDDISTMTGDKSGTIRSLLSGYNFMNQLEHETSFDRGNTIRKGRGSNVNYPFSWVYTLFNHTVPKAFLNLNFFDDNEKPISRPIPEEKLDDAVFVIDAMFGNSKLGQDALLDDSRQISKFAEALGDPDKVRHLRNGKKLKEVENLTANINKRLEDIFFHCIELLEEANNRVTKEAENITNDVFVNTQRKLVQSNNLLRDIKKKLDASQIKSSDSFDL